MQNIRPTVPSFLQAHLKWLAPVLVALPIMIAILCGVNVAGLLGLTFASAASIHCALMIGLCAITWQCLNWALIPLTRMAHPEFNTHLSKINEPPPPVTKEGTKNDYILKNQKLKETIDYFNAVKKGSHQDHCPKAFWAMYMMALPVLVPHVVLFVSPFLTGLTLFMAPVMLMWLYFVVQYFRHAKNLDQSRPYLYMIVHFGMALWPILGLGAITCAACYLPAWMAHLSSAWLWTQIFPAVVLGAVVMSVGMHLAMNIWSGQKSLDKLLRDGFKWLPMYMGLPDEVSKGIACVCMTFFFLPIAGLQWFWALIARPNEMMLAYRQWCKNSENVKEHLIKRCFNENNNKAYCVLAKSFQVHRNVPLYVLMHDVDDQIKNSIECAEKASKS